jgi:hypothetical protein
MDLLIPLISILGSGVVSAFVAQKLINSRTEKDFKRKKLEELFLAIDKFCVSLSMAHFAWTRVAKGELTYNEALDLIINLDKKEYSGVFQTAQMLTILYFPEMLPAFKKILDIRARLTALQFEFKTIYKEIGPIPEFANKFSIELIAVEQASEQFKNGLAEIAKNI